MGTKFSMHSKFLLSSFKGFSLPYAIILLLQERLKQTETVQSSIFVDRWPILLLSSRQMSTCTANCLATNSCK